MWACAADVPELGVPVRVLRPSSILALPCMLNSSPCSSRAPSAGLTGCPCRGQFPGQVRTVLAVHATATSDHPERSSTSATSAAGSPGSRLGRGFRPAARHAGPGPPAVRPRRQPIRRPPAPSSATTAAPAPPRPPRQPPAPAPPTPGTAAASAHPGAPAAPRPSPPGPR